VRFSYVAYVVLQLFALINTVQHLDVLQFISAAGTWPFVCGTKPSKTRTAVHQKPRVTAIDRVVCKFVVSFVLTVTLNGHFVLYRLVLGFQMGFVT